MERAAETPAESPATRAGGGAAHLGGIDANLIIALSALLSEQSVTRAASKTFLAQSSMSHALSRLRLHFHDQLLVREGRQMVLTPRAKSLVEPVQLAIAHLERVFTRTEKFDPGTSDRTFHLVATDNLELYILPRLAALMSREAPGVKLRVHHLPVDWMEALANGDIDLKLGRKYRIPRSFQSEDLFEERLVCVVRKGHPLKTSRLSAKQLSQLPQVVVVPGAMAGERGFVDGLLAERGLSQRIVATVSHFLVAPHVVAASNLALIASERLLSAFMGPLQLRLVRLPVTLPSYTLTQVWAERSRFDEGHRWLRGAVVRSIRG